MLRKAWTESDAQRLRELRERAGTPQAAFAKRHALSLGQVRELEGGKPGSFYSDDIKAHTGRKLLAALGYVPPTEPPAPAEQPAASAGPDSPAPDMDSGTLTRPEPVRDASTEASEPPPDPPGSSVQPVSEPAPVAALPEDLQPTRSPPEAASSRRSVLPVAALALVAAIAGVWALTNQTSFRPGGVSTVTEPVQVAAAASEPAPPPEARASEPAAVASAPASRASAPASAAAAAGPVRLPPGCEAAAGREPTQYTSPVADKPASYVYVESIRGDARVCVIDSLNQARLVTLKQGESVNVSGTPPFTIRSAQWNDLKVFFQGLRVQLEPGAVTDHVVILPRRGG